MENIPILFFLHFTASAPALISPIRVLDPVNELEEVSTKNPVIMGNPTSIQINKGDKGLGISIVGGIDTPMVRGRIFILIVIVFNLFHCTAKWPPGHRM